MTFAAHSLWRSPFVCGVYRCTNIVNGKRYVGSTKNFCGREKGHARYLKAGKHRNAPFQNAWNKYGSDKFLFEPLEAAGNSRKELEAAEQFWIDALEPEYNVSRIAGRVEFTLEVRAKMSAAAIGKNISVETRAKMSAALKGKPKSPEHRAKLISALTGRQCSDETRAKIGAGNKGKIVSAETRAKLSVALKGNPNLIAALKSSPKRSSVSRAMWKDPTYRTKVLVAHSTKECRAKISAASKSMWAKRRTTPKGALA